VAAHGHFEPTAGRQRVARDRGRRCGRGIPWTRSGPFADALWLRIVGAGFEAGVVGGLADWFAVTALFRHPLGLPIPHTAIIPARRAKKIESIVNMVEEEWLSPEVIGQRLTRLSPSDLVVDWLCDPEHVERVGGPVRDLLRGVARTLTEDELATRGARHRAPAPRHARRLERAVALRLVASDSADAAFTAFATSSPSPSDRGRQAAYDGSIAGRSPATAGARSLPPPAEVR
jgi:hypothetical protein